MNYTKDELKFLERTASEYTRLLFKREKQGTWEFLTEAAWNLARVALDERRKFFGQCSFCDKRPPDTSTESGLPDPALAQTRTTSIPVVFRMCANCNKPEGMHYDPNAKADTCCCFRSKPTQNS